METAEPTSSERTEERLPELAFRFAMRTDVGMRRAENQDSYGYVRSRDAALFIVADGMGGARGGATASALAIDVIAKSSVNDSGRLSEQSLKSAIEKANKTIFDRARDDENLTGMGTTVVALALFGDRALVAHVGDSRIYLFRGGEITRLTRDHTLVQELLESGAISPDQAENHPIAHMLTRSLGPAGSVEVDARVLTQNVVNGDRFLLCCDGLYNMVTEDEIARVFRDNDLQTAAETLVELANERGGTDNITVQCIEACPFNSVPQDLGAWEVEIFTSSDVEAVENPPLEDDNDERVVDEPVGNGAAKHTNGANGSQHAQAESANESAAESPTAESDRPLASEDAQVKATTKQATDSKPSEGERSRSRRDEDDDFIPADEAFADFKVEETESSAEVSEQELRQLKKIQIGAVSALVLALVVLVYALWPAQTPKELAQVASVDDSSPVAGEAPEPVEAPVQEPSGEPAVAPSEGVDIGIDPGAELAERTAAEKTLEDFSNGLELPPTIEVKAAEPAAVEPVATVPPVITAPLIITEPKSETKLALNTELPTAQPKPVQVPVVERPVEVAPPPPEPKIITETKPAIEPKSVVTALPPVVEPPVEVPPVMEAPKESLAAKTSVAAAPAPSAANDWPDASTVPNAPTAALEALAVPHTTQKDDPTLSQYKLPENSRDISRVIASASDLNVPPPPVLQSRTKGSPDQPIIWEHEKIAMEKGASDVSSATRAPATNAISGAAEQPSSLVKSDKERRALAAQKTDSRERVASIDTKLRLFNLKDAKEAGARLVEIDKEIASIDQALDQTNKNIETARRRYQVWLNRQDLAVTGDAIKMADEVAITSVQVKRKKEGHDVASMRYLDTVELWRENPSDNTATTNMAALGRELKTRRGELEEAIIQAVNSSVEQAKFDIAEFGTVKTDLERRKDRLNRHAGFYKAYAVQVSGNRVGAQRQLLDERAKSVTELEELKLKFSDEEELQFRRESVLRQLGVTK